MLTTWLLSPHLMLLRLYFGLSSWINPSQFSYFDFVSEGVIRDRQDYNVEHLRVAGLREG